MTNHRRFLWYPTAPELHKETTFSIFLIFFFFRECFICGAGPIPIKAYFVVLSRDCGILKAPPRSATNSNYTRNIMILNFSASSSGFAFCWVLRSFSRAELCPIGISFRNVHCSRQIFLLFYIMCLKGHWFISVSCCLLPLFVTLFLHWWYLSRSKNKMKTPTETKLFLAKCTSTQVLTLSAISCSIRCSSDFVKVFHKWSRFHFWGPLSFINLALGDRQWNLSARQTW